MRRFFRTAVGKTVLFMLTMVAGVAAVASAVGIAFMAGGNVYSRTQQQVYDDLMENMMIQDGRMIAMKAGNTYWVPAKEVEKQKEGK